MWCVHTPQGELAEGFGTLMALLWKGGVGHVSPRRFKERIGRFAPQFSGYAQHDSQVTCVIRGRGCGQAMANGGALCYLTCLGCWVVGSLHASQLLPLTHLCLSHLCTSALPVFYP